MYMDFLRDLDTTKYMKRIEKFIATMWSTVTTIYKTLQPSTTLEQQLRM